MMRSSDFGHMVKCRLRDADAFAKGGAVDKVREAGRFGDDLVIHINQDELKELVDAWGPYTVNPDTGMPEFFLKGLKDFLGDNPWVAPLATSVLAPGLGSAIGGGVSNALGLGLQGAGASALGQGLLGAGLGALTGGGQGALIGGLTGGLFGGGNLFGGGGGQKALDASTGGYGPPIPDNMKQDSGGLFGNLFGGSGGGGLKNALPLMMIAGTLSQTLKKDKDGALTISNDQQKAIAEQNKPLSNVPFRRKYKGPPKNALTYGYGPERQMFSGNQLELPGYAKGGKPRGALAALPAPRPSRYVEGPGTGRSDDVPALLSKGEYVLDAEAVSMLGDGSPEAGAKALDKFRENIRRHKGGALAKGRISPNAKDPAAYLPRKGRK